VTAKAHRIITVGTHDSRFTASRDLGGPDTMNANPDHSAACVVPRTGADDGHKDAA
jgi:L-fuconate dehydratase